MGNEGSEGRDLAVNEIWATRYFLISNFDLAKSTSQRKKKSSLLYS